MSAMYSTGYRQAAARVPCGFICFQRAFWTASIVPNWSRCFVRTSITQMRSSFCFSKRIFGIPRIWGRMPVDKEQAASGLCESQSGHQFAGRGTIPVCLFSKIFFVTFSRWSENINIGPKEVSQKTVRLIRDLFYELWSISSGFIKSVQHDRRLPHNLVAVIFQVDNESPEKNRTRVEDLRHHSTDFHHIFTKPL